MKALSPSFFDRFLAGVAPSYATRRFNAKLAFHMAGQYAGARNNRQALKSFNPFAGSATSDSIGDLPALRARSRDLDRNNPIATGAKATARSHTVGTGLTLRAEIYREILGLSPKAAEAWERNAEELFEIWASSIGCDVTLTQNFYELQGLVFNTVFESGDTLVLRRRSKLRSVVPLALAVIEADRIATPTELQNDDTVRAGVRVDPDGAPISYFVADDHPGDSVVSSLTRFAEVRAFGEKSGERMALHVFRRMRPGQPRGVPELAPVIEILKQLDRYTEAELMSAVVASFFTVFLKTDGEEGLAGATPPLPGMGREEITMGAGSIASIGTNESIEVANPARTNTNFDPFFSAIIRQIGVALSIPYELLIMHFTSSYSASRAALEMAAQFFRERRAWLVSAFCQPVYEWFLIDAITTGLISAPGFFESPVKRAAWLGAQWVPPTRIVLDPLKEWKAEAVAVNELGAKTIEQVAMEKTGGNWKSTTEQRQREHKARADAGLEPAVLGQSGPATPEDGADEEDGPTPKRKADADS